MSGRAGAEKWKKRGVQTGSSGKKCGVKAHRLHKRAPLDKNEKGEGRKREKTVKCLKSPKTFFLKRYLLGHLPENPVEMEVHWMADVRGLRGSVGRVFKGPFYQKHLPG